MLSPTLRSGCVSQLWRHLTPAAFECSFKVGQPESFSHMFWCCSRTPPTPTPTPSLFLHLQSPSFSVVFFHLTFDPVVLHHGLLHPACSLTPPARQWERELDSPLTLREPQSRRPKQSALKGATRPHPCLDAAMVSAHMSRTAERFQFKCFHTAVMCNAKLDCTLHTHLKLVLMLTQQ